MLLIVIAEVILMAATAINLAHYVKRESDAGSLILAVVCFVLALVQGINLTIYLINGRY